jgi:hypothetical protein
MPKTHTAFFLRRDSTVIRFAKHREYGDNMVMVTRYEDGKEMSDIMGITHNFFEICDARVKWSKYISFGFAYCEEPINA